MQQATQLQVPPSGQSSHQPIPNLQDKAGTPRPQPQHQPPASKETLLQQPDKDKTVARHIPHLRAVVESQAFKNVLVDEMDMMLSRAATLIQANWRGYRLRQKLISQMMAAKAIQEAWRRFNTRRLLRSGKTVEKRVKMEERDIPYHPPQQVRFQHPEEGKSLLAPPIMLSKETQFPSSDSLATYTEQLALLQSQGMSQPGVQATCAVGGPSVTFLPHQAVAIKLPCPVSLEAKCHPCLLTGTVRSSCVVHVEGDTTKTKPVTGRANKAGATGPPLSGRYAQAVHGQLKTQTQAHMEAEVFKAPPQTGPTSVITKTPPQPVPTITVTKTPLQMYPAARITKTPLQPCPVPMVTITKTPLQVHLAAPVTKTPAQTYPAATVTKTPLQSCLAAMMNKIPPQPCPAPMVTITKTPPQVYPAAPVTKTPPQTYPPAMMTKTPLQSCLAAMMNKIQSQPCPAPAITITKTPPQPCPVTPMTKTPVQMRPTASVTNTSPQTRPAAMMTKIPPQLCLLASMIKSPPQTRPTATMTKTPPQTCMVPMMAKTSPQMRPAATMTKTQLQTCQAATMAKTPSHQMLQGGSVTKAPPQTRLAAMITKTPAQLRSVATILRTLCLPPPAAAENPKPSLSAAAAAGIPDTSSHTCLSGPKTKAVGNTRQAAGVVKDSSRSYLTEGKVKYFSPSHLGAGAPKVPAKPPLEGEKIKAFSQKQVKMETVFDTSVAMEMPGALSWAKVAEDRNKQAHLRADIMKIQSRVYAPVETAVVPQAQLDTCPDRVSPPAQPGSCSTTISSQRHLLAELTRALPQAHLGTCLSKPLSQAYLSTKLTKAPSQGYPPSPAELTAAPAQPHLATCLSKVQSQAHLPTKLTKAQSQAQLVTGAIKIQSQAHLPAGLTKAQSQAQLVTETAKCLHAAHQAAELSSKTQSQPLLIGFKASTQPCQHISALGTLPRAKPEDRLTQLPSHSHVQAKATQGPCQGVSETQNVLVPLLASAGHTTCNVESWGDSGATRAQPSMTSSAPPCQEELAASQLASLCAELAAVLGSQEDLRALLAKALSQGEVRAALNQALSKEVLGATMAKALPQGILGTALVKALSWGELGTTLSRALSQGELRAELTKAIQGRLADVLSKALTEEERATFNQALCQGELGAVLSQSLSQAALRSGVVLPKAASKTAGSRMTVMPTPVEVDYRGSPSAAWGPTLGSMRLQPGKVRFPWGGAWEGFVTNWPSGLLGEMGDGAMLVGSPCSSVVSVGALLIGKVVTTIHQYFLLAALDPTLSWEMGPSRDSLNLSSGVNENVCLHPGASKLASDLNPVLSDIDSNLPKSPHQHPPCSIWQPLTANGVGPSTSRPSLAGGGMTPSSHNPPEVSTVAPRPWASSREGRVAPAKLPRTTGGRRATHSHQCAATSGGSACWCQPSGVGRVPPGMCRSSVAKGPQQPSMVPKEILQRTQSPNHRRASMGTREMTNKVTPSPPHATTVTKVPLIQPQAPKACVITPGLRPDSMAPGHHWALKTQVDPRVFQASSGKRLALTLPRVAISRQEKNQTRGTISSGCCPQELVTNHILKELVASLPQGSDSDLARSFSQGSTGYGPNVSNSQSSLCSCSSLSLSTMSVASLTTVDLVEGESWEASLDKDFHQDALLSGEARDKSQGPGNMEEIERAGVGHVTLNLHDQSSGASELIPILHHSSVSSRMTLSVHWGSDDWDEGNMSSGQSSMDLRESLSQKPYKAGLTRSLSFNNVPTAYQWSSVASRLTPCLSQPTIASKVAPNPSQPSMASRVIPSLSELSMASKMTPTLGVPSKTNRVDLCLAQPCRVSGVAISLGQPPVICEVAPSLPQLSMTDEVAPSFAQPLMAGGVALSLAQPPVTSGVAPSLAQPPVTGGVTPSLAQTSMTGGVTPSQAQPSATSGVTPSLPQLSVTSAVTPSLAQPPVTSGVTPSLAQPLVTGGVTPTLTQPSTTSGVTPSLAQPPVTGGVTPSLAQPLVTGGVNPSLAQPSMTGGVTPSRAQPSATSGVTPSLSQLSVTGGVTPSLAQPSTTSGVTPSVAQPPMTSEVTPSLTQLSVTNGVTPSLAQPSMTGGVTPSRAQPPATSWVTPSLAQLSVTGGVTPSLAQPFMTGGVTPSLDQPSMTGGVTPSLDQPSLTSGVTPSLAQPPVAGGIASSLGQTSMISRVAPSLAHPAMTSEITPSLAQPHMTSRVDLSLGQPSMAAGVTPSTVQPSMRDGMTPSLAQPSVPGGVAPSLAQTFMTGGVVPNLGQTSRVGGVAPSLAQSSMTIGVTPSLGQPYLTIGMTPCLAQPSFAGGVAPSLGQPSMACVVAPSLSQPSLTSRGPPSQAQSPVTSGAGCALSQPSWAPRVGSNLPSSRVNAVAPTLSHSSFAIEVTSCTPYPSLTNGLGQGLSQPTMSTRVDPCQDPLMVSGVASNPQAPEFSEISLGFYQPHSIGGRRPSITEQSAVTVSAPNLYQASITSGGDSCLGQGTSISQGILFQGMAASMSQGTMAAGTLPGVSQGTLAAGMFLSMSRVPMSPGMSRSMCRRSVATGMGPRQSQGARGVAPLTSRASLASAPLIHQPVSGVRPGFSQASVPSGLDMSLSKFSLSSVSPSISQIKGSLPIPLDHQCPSVSTISTSSYQQAHGGSQQPGMGITRGVVPGSVASRISTAVAPGSMAEGMAPSPPPGSVIRGVGQSLPPGSMVTCVAPSLPPGYMINGVVQTLLPGSVISSMGQGLPPGPVISGIGQGPPPGPVISGIGQGPPPGPVIGGMGQGPPPGPVIGGMGQGPPPGSVIGGMGQGPPPGSVICGMGQGPPPGSVICSIGQGPPPGPVIGGMGQGLPPGPVIGGMGQGPPPGSVICGIGQGPPPGSVICGMGQGLPPGPVIGGMGQGFPPGSVANGMARTLSPSSVVTGVSPSPIAASGAGGKRQGLSVRPSASLTAPNLLLGSAASGVGPGIPPGPVASSMAPSSMNQSLVLGSMASAAGPPSTVRSMAQGLPHGSLLIGITPRPYHGILSGEGSTASFQASHATGLAQVHPQTLEANGTAKGVHQVPTVLQKASELSQALGMMPFETIGRQTGMKPEDVDKVLPQESISRRGSEVLEATPWMYHSPLATDIDYGHDFPPEDETLPKGQRPLLKEVAPSQAKSMASGMASVPPQSLSFAKNSIASGGTPALQQKTATSWGAHSSHSVAASRVPGVHQQASVPHVVPRSPSVARVVPRSPSAYQKALVAHIVPRSPSVAHVPRSHSRGMMASAVVSRSPKLASLHPGSVAGMGTPSTSRRSGATSVSSHVPLHPPLARGVAPRGFQKEAIPSALWKPVSGDLIQNGHRYLSHRKSYRSMHGIPVPQRPENSVAKIVPSHQVQEDASKSSQEVLKNSIGAPVAIMPIIRTAIPRLNLGARRVSLGYESSPSGSLRPLFNQKLLLGSQDSHSSVAPVDSHRASLTPTVLQGPKDAGVSGGQAWNSVVPSVAVGRRNSTVAPCGAWEPPRDAVPWDAMGSKVAVDPRQPGELVASVQAVEKIIIHAVVIIQACTRGYLVRRTIKIWHQWAIIIQAAWRGYCVRRDLARLCRAVTIIQAAWRGFCTRRSHAQQMLLPSMWAEVGARARSTSDHRCFQSCQPHDCTLCRSLSSGLGSPPSVVMLVGSSPRTCHMCGHTLPTRVVHGMGRGAAVQAVMPRSCITQSTPRSPRQPHPPNKAATAIQSAWRGFTVRRRLKQQQLAAKTLQATWRGHSTRASLTTDALLGSAMSDNSRHTQWPGI
ncbi:IQ domain-containing protein N [Camelus bactrianus]|uniref:IQ domain-containing protein N n=1 Tax=Camelus bactrianus TaxID=9837 RepID=A0AC58P8Z8_CAMBA